MFKMFKILIILIILIRIQDIQDSSYLNYFDFVDKSFLSNCFMKSDVRRIILISTRLVTLSLLFKNFRFEIIYSFLLC